MEMDEDTLAAMPRRRACLDDIKRAGRTLAETMLKPRLGQNRNCDLFRCQAVDRDRHVGSSV